MILVGGALNHLMHQFLFHDCIDASAVNVDLLWLLRLNTISLSVNVSHILTACFSGSIAGISEESN